MTPSGMAQAAPRSRRERGGPRALRGVVTAAVAVAAALTTGIVSADASAGHLRDAPAAGWPAVGWPAAGQNIDDTHSQPDEHVISAANVGQLVPRWVLTTTGDVSATPTVYAGIVYVSDSGGTLWAVDARTGRPAWHRTIASYTHVAGDLSRTSPVISGGDIITGDGWVVGPPTRGPRVFAINRMTGKLRWLTQVDTFPDAFITSSPVVYRGVAYVGVSSSEEGLAAQPGYPCCSFRGKVVALSTRTGRILWQAYTMPSDNNGRDANHPGYYTGGAVGGSSPVVDPATGLVYVGTGNNYTVPAGVCDTPGQSGCTPPATDDYFDSILALRLRDGTVAWADRTAEADQFNGAHHPGNNFDFISAPNLFTARDPATGRPEQLLGAGQKSGFYWAVNPRNGQLAWSTKVGPGSSDGGMEFGSATDGRRLYVAESDFAHKPYVLAGSGAFAGQTVTGGSWAALDPATGTIVWQTPDPQSAVDIGFVSTANGVVYAGSNMGTGDNMYALDAATGNIAWAFASGGSVASGAAIVDGSVYWGSGYYITTCPASRPSCGASSNLYAFGLPSPVSADAGRRR